MMIYIGSDHAGFNLKETLRQHMKDKGMNVVDVGTFSAEKRVDYPDFAQEVGQKVLENSGSLGVLICGTGIGMSIAANKVKGIRAAHVADVTQARLARQHNNANVVTMGERTTGPETAKDIVDTFLSTDFEGGRHEGRVEKITALENEQ